MQNRATGTISIIIILGIITLVIFQLIPYGKDHTNPSIVSEPNWDSPQTRVLAKKACFDCQSNETTWPWYSNFAPVSWLVHRNVDEARRRMNFSDWQNSYMRDTNEINSEINAGGMPPFTYFLMQMTAKLSSSEKSELTNGLTSTLSQ